MWLLRILDFNSLWLVSSVSSALMGAQLLFLWIAGTCKSSLKGEVKALISAALISVSQNVSQLPTVYSNHLQSICLIEDIQSNTLPPNFQVYQLAWSLYWWLKSVLPCILDTVFQHIKAGSSAFDPASQLNHIADTAATTAHYQPSYFSLWSPNKGFIEFISLISSPLAFWSTLTSSIFDSS